MSRHPLRLAGSQAQFRIALVLCLVLAAVQWSCASRSERVELLPDEQAAPFGLTLYPDTYAGGGQADEIYFRETSSASGPRIEIHARGAQQLKALFYRLSYDQQRYSVLRVNETDVLSSASDGLLVALTAQPGIVEFGQMRARPQEHVAEGFSGDGLLCSIDFSRRPAELTRSVSQVPLSDDARSSLVFNPVGPQLEWRLFNPGDYNQDGQVLASDLTPIGIHFNEAVPAGASPDEPDINSVQAVIDGNGDNKVAVADLTAIGLNFQNKILSYRVFRSSDPADVPTSNAGANGPGSSIIGTVQMAEALGTAGSERLRFEQELQGDPDGAIYWVRPFDGSSEGTPSNAALGGNGPNQPPLVDLQADASEGSAPLSVNFDASASVDEDGLAALSFTWDFEGDGTFDTVPDNSPTINHVYADAGQFNPTVRVTDTASLSSTASVPVLVNTAGNVLPTANLIMSAIGTDAPIQVTLDASGSVDSDGTIEEYRFDLDNDGKFEKSFNAAEQPIISMNLSGNGNYTFTLQVVDNDQGTDKDSETLLVAGGFRISEVDDLGRFVEPVDLAVAPFNRTPTADSRFLVAYMDDGRRLKHVTSSDQFGDSWGSTVQVAANGCDHRNAALHLGVVSGKPTISFIDEVTGSSIQYVRANDGNGLSWPASQLVSNGQRLRSPVLRIVDSVPSVAYMSEATSDTGNASVFFVKSKNSVGSGSWNAPISVDAGFRRNQTKIEVPRVQLLFVSGDQEPAVLCNCDQLFRERADNKKGSDWDGDAKQTTLFDIYASSFQLEAGDEANGVVVADALVEGKKDVVAMHITNAFGAFSLNWPGDSEVYLSPDISPLIEFRRDINGFGIAVWHDNDINALMFARSLDENASSYGPAQVIDFVDTDCFDMTLMNSNHRILIVYFDKAQGVIKAANI